MPFKVIQGHRFWYQSKAHMQLPITDYSNLPPILYRFQVIYQIFAFDRGRFTSTPPPGVIPCEYPDKLYLFRN